MASKREVIQSFIERMDYSEGGRLHAVVNKATAENAPFLIIGLGGMGAEAVLRVKEMIYDRLECEEAIGVESGKPKNIDYYVIDTDASVRKNKLHGIRLSEEMGELRLFCHPHIQSIIHGKLPECIDSWLNKNILLDNVTMGAGGIRQVGRLMMFLNVTEIVSDLQNKITRITADFDQDTPLNVFVITGLGGGTGSGMFLDIPYLVRNVALQINAARTVRTTGMFVLPDLQEFEYYCHGKQYGQIQANAYAALKELNNLMNRGIDGERFRQDYGSVQVSCHNGKTYDICLLLSGRNENMGGSLKKKEYICETAAQIMLNLVTSSAPNPFCIIDSFCEALSVFGRDMYCCSVGVSERRMPLDEAAGCLASKCFDGIRYLWGNEPEPQDVSSVVQYLGITKQQLVNAGFHGGPGKPIEEERKGLRLPDEINRVRYEYEKAYKQYQMILQERIGDMSWNLEQLLMNPNGTLEQIAADPDKGPSYAAKIWGRSWNDGVRLELEKNLGELKDDLYHHEGRIGRTIELSERALDEMVHRRSFLPSVRKRQAEAFWESADDAFRCICAVETEKCLCGFMSDTYHRLENIFGTRYYEAGELQRLFMHIFQAFFEMYTIAEDDETARRSRTPVESLVRVPELVQLLEDQMAVSPFWHVDYQTVIGNFYKYLLEHWDMENSQSILGEVEEAERFLAAEFQNATDRPLDMYLSLISPLKGQTTDEFCDVMLQEMRTQADYLFPISLQHANVHNHPEVTFVFTPNNSINAYNALLVHGDAADNLIPSQIGGSFRIMQFKTFIPICAYDGRERFRGSYRSIMETSPGLHLWEGSERNWRELPDL